MVFLLNESLRLKQDKNIYLFQQVAQNNLSYIIKTHVQTVKRLKMHKCVYKLIKMRISLMH